MNDISKKRYWARNLRYSIILISIAIIFGILIPTLFFEPLNEFRFMGFPLGFWFGMQGSILILCSLLFIYAFLMNKLDKKYGFDKSINR